MFIIDHFRGGGFMMWPILALNLVSWAIAFERAFALYADRTWQWPVHPADVLAVPDVVSALAHAVSTLTEPGAGVVVNPPVYHPFFTVISITKRTLVEVPMSRDTDGRYGLDLDGLADAFARPDVSAFLLCSPHNPTGTVLSEAELRGGMSRAQRRFDTGGEFR